MRKKANRRRATLQILLSTCVIFLVCMHSTSAETGQVTAQLDIGTIARDACKGVGVVHNVSQGTTGSPIIILEENHASRSGQIQNAITLVRLYKRYGLRQALLKVSL